MTLAEAKGFVKQVDRDPERYNKVITIGTRTPELAYLYPDQDPEQHYGVHIWTDDFEYTERDAREMRDLLRELR